MSQADPTRMAMQRPSRWRREWTLVTLLLALAAALLGWLGWTSRADLAVYDAALSVWTQPAPSDVLIVAIDDDSLQAIGRWPWRRAIHATAINHITEGKPKAILLNLLLSEPDSDPTQDAVLSEAMSRSGRVVLPVGLATGPGGQARELAPISPLASHATLAHAEAALDVDGVVRWAYLKAGVGRPHLPHMASALLAVGEEQPHAAITAQLAPSRADTQAASSSELWTRDDRIPIRYLGPSGSIETVSYSDVISGHIAAERFKDRYVLIGVTAHGLGDTYLTPVSGHTQPMASVEITGHVLNMLRTGQQIRWASPEAVALGSASLVLLLMAGFWSLSPRRALLAAVLCMVAAPAISIMAVGAGVWFPPGSLMVITALSYPIWSWRRLEATSSFLNEELSALCADPGIVMPMQATHLPPPDDNDYLDRQIHAVRQASRQLQEARRLVDDTLGSLPCAVLVLDKQGAVQRVNGQFVKLMRGAAQVAEIGHDAARLLSPWTPNNAPHWPMLIERALQGNLPTSSEVQGPSGDEHLVGLVPLRDENDQPQGLIICLTDITALRRAEQHRDELLGFIAHDIRSPQASLVSLVQLQRMAPGGMSLDHMLNHIDNLAHSTLQLCEELLQIMRSESRPLLRDRLDLNTLISQACSEAEPQALAKGISLVHPHHPTETAEIMGDSAQLKRALLNLLTNAIKFSPPDSRVMVWLEREGDRWRVSVRDEGKGIAPADVARLFKRYERLDADEHVRLAPGIGLGLVFVETVVRRHGGSIQVHSEPGRGSTFEIVLPGSLDVPAPA